MTIESAPIRPGDTIETVAAPSVPAALTAKGPGMSNSVRGNARPARSRLVDLLRVGRPDVDHVHGGPGGAESGRVGKTSGGRGPPGRV